MKIQRIIDKFVWAGRSRAARATVALPRIEVGLGLLGVEAQYNALSSSILIWIMATGDHPLKTILRSHIYAASARRWGTEDLTWIVTQCGTMKMEGSALWCNLCSRWAALKKWLSPRQPANEEEWGDLPLWRPHINHLDEKLVRCNTIAQRSLRLAGFQVMADVFHLGNVPIQWEEAWRREAPVNCERAFNALILNLKVILKIGPPDDDQDMFQEDTLSNCVWQYRFAASRATERWVPFMNREEPVRTFRKVGFILSAIARCSLPPAAHLQRIVVRAPWHCG